MNWLLLPLAQAADAVPAASESLNTAGLTVMVCSVGAVLTLMTFCMYRVLTLPPVENEEDEYDPPRSLSM
jgi:hypothetical protein